MQKKYEARCTQTRTLATENTENTEDTELGMKHDAKQHWLLMIYR